NASGLRKAGGTGTNSSAGRSCSARLQERRAGSEKLNAQKQPICEVRLEIGVVNFARGFFDVVGDSSIFERAALGIKKRVRAARIVIARLPDRTNTDDVLEALAQRKFLRHDFERFAFPEREGFAQMRMPDERDVGEIAPHGLQRRG